MRNRRQRMRPVLDQLDDRCLLSGYSPISSSGYTPSQLAGAYGLNTIAFPSSSGAPVKGDGTGETIALIEMYSDPNIQSDLKTFDATYNLPNPELTVVDQAGSQPNSGWAQEEALDVEWAHAIAPGANILVVEAAPAYSETQELQSLLSAVNTARNTAGVVAVSMSWGINEMPNEASFDSNFTTPAGHTGITFIASSGDNGIVEYPAASPYVLAVGGTTLSLSTSGTYLSESAWYDSGGGYSQYEPEPSYQESVQQTGMRSVPDVAFDGDPNTGVEVYSTDPISGEGSWQVFGGTSVGAPAWAGVIAIVDQGRALTSKSSLDGASETLPALYAAPSTSFNSVSSSTPGFPSGGGLPPGGFDPFGGYDYSSAYGYGLSAGSFVTTSAGATANTATGLGSPIGSSLIDDLVASTLTTPLTTSTGSSSGSATPPKAAGHHAKHEKKAKSHIIKRTKSHAATTHRRELVKQGEKGEAHTKLVVHHSKES
jgi:subtilase family serine protease